MIYLKKTNADKRAATFVAKKYGYYPAAVYDEGTDRIIILKTCHNSQEMANIMNHEFMHRILFRNGLEKACLKWDSEFIGHVESWLGWLGPLEMAIEDFIWFVKKHF